ncbi:MAG: hypothetical protein QM744_19110 [Mesorhizobium sp.]
MISAILCYIHLRATSILITLFVGGSFTAFFATRGVPEFSAMAVNMLLVAAGALTIALMHGRAFERMVEVAKHSKALANQNSQLANLNSLTALPNRRRFFPISNEYSAMLSRKACGWLSG